MSAHEAFEHANERIEHAHGGGEGQHHDRLLPLVAAILAVLTALASLFAHHKSISALALKTEATLKQSQAGDQYSYYESKRIKYHIYNAIAATQTNPAAAKALKTTADREMSSAEPVLADAKRLEQDSKDRIEQSETVLRAYETLELGATSYEIAIVFVSISALAHARWLLWVGSGLAAVGTWFFVSGLLMH